MLFAENLVDESKELEGYRWVWSRGLPSASVGPIVPALGVRSNGPSADGDTGDTGAGAGIGAGAGKAPPAEAAGSGAPEGVAAARSGPRALALAPELGRGPWASVGGSTLGTSPPS